MIVIAGTTFALGDFERVWPQYQMRAARWVDDEAVQEARERHNSGNGVCMVSEDGLIVLTLETSDNGEDRLFMLLGVSTGQPGAIRRQEQAIIAIAHDLGVHRVAFKTRRVGFERLLGPKWTRDGNEFSRSV